jgi:hypothetical protein
MDSSARLVIRVCEPALALPLSQARAQAYTAAAPLARWELLPKETEPSDASHSAQRAVVLIGADSSEVTRWLRTKWAVIADGIWSEDPAEITEVVNLARAMGQPLVQGDELLHAPVLAGAITEASEIGAITSCEFRGVYPRDWVSDFELLHIHAPSVVMRGLLCLEMLLPPHLRAAMIWDPLNLMQSVGREAQATVRGEIPSTADTPSTRIQMSIATHRGNSVIQDLQFSSATGVVRAELMPTPHLEINGEPIILPEATHTPAQLEWFGMMPMLDLLRRAVRERTQPLTGPSLLAAALQILPT